MEVYNAAALNKAPKIAAYEIEEDTYSADLADFALANSIYAALVEGHAAEVSRFRRVGQFDLRGFSGDRSLLVVTPWTTPPRTLVT